SLKVQVKGAAEATQVAVTVDGVEVPVAALLAPRKVNPGTHVVVAKSAGREGREQVVLKEGDSRDVVVMLAGSEPAPMATGAGGVGDATPTASPSRPLKTVGIIALGVAAAGLATGAVAGFIAINSKDEAKKGCSPDNKCPPPTHEDIDLSRNAGYVSTVGFIVAGAGAAIGITALLLSPKSPARQTGASV